MGQQTHSIHPGHDQIKHNQGKCRFFKHLYRGKTITDHHRREGLSKSGKMPLQQMAQHLVIIDKKDLSFHPAILFFANFCPFHTRQTTQFSSTRPSFFTKDIKTDQAVALPGKVTENGSSVGFFYILHKKHIHS
jgi:hypothetical protein